MKSYVFRVVVEQDAFAGGERAYHAYCPALKGCHAWGRTVDEALANIREGWNCSLRISVKPGNRYRTSLTGTQ